MQARPVVEREIDDDQSRCWQFLGHPLARGGLARRNQPHREIVNAGIVADNEQRPRSLYFGDQAHQCFRRGIIDALLVCGLRGPGKARSEQRPCFLGTRCRRDQSELRNEAVSRHISAENGHIGAAAFGELALAIGLAGFGTLGLGVTQQHEAAHGGNVAF